MVFSFVRLYRHLCRKQIAINMTSIFKICLLFFVILWGLSGCKHEIPDRPKGPTPQTLSDTCHLDTVYFANEILPIFQSNCAQSGCHDAIAKEGGIQLTEYEDIINTGGVEPGKANESKLYKSLLETDPEKLMPPPTASLTPEQKNAIRIWINQGAPNNKCRNICDTIAVSFKINVWPIMEASCRGCHTRPSGFGGIFISNYTDVKSLVTNGKLGGVIKGKPGSPLMPPPPAELEKCARDQIRIWIDNGALNN
jgi:Planctomycete cytochrome C